MKIERVLFPSVFSKITDPCVGRSFSMCSQIRLLEPTKVGTLKANRVNGLLNFVNKET